MQLKEICLNTLIKFHRLDVSSAWDVFAHLPFLGLVEQSRTCHISDPCQSYTWRAGPWGGCDHGKDLCGHGISYRSVHCQAADGGRVRHGMSMFRYL